jgi:hypothetical protein
MKRGRARRMETMRKMKGKKKRDEGKKERRNEGIEYSNNEGLSSYKTTSERQVWLASTRLK